MQALQTAGLRCLHAGVSRRCAASRLADPACMCKEDAAGGPKSAHIHGKGDDNVMLDDDLAIAATRF